MVFYGTDIVIELSLDGFSCQSLGLDLGVDLNLASGFIFVLIIVSTNRRLPPEPSCSKTDEL